MATTLGAVVAGGTVYIKENGVPVEFYVAGHDYNSDLNGYGRTLLLRKEVHSIGAFNKIASQSNRTVSSLYTDSNLDTWFNSEYLNSLDSSIRNLIPTTKFYISVPSGGHAIISRKVFALSVTEFGFNTEGVVYALDGPDIALGVGRAIALVDVNGVSSNYWTSSRASSGDNNSDGKVYRIFTNWGNANTQASELWGYDESGYWYESIELGRRPAFTLPETF